MRTVTLEPVLDENPIVIVDGDGTVLDCNLAWTRLVSVQRRTGLRTSLFDVVSFVGAASPPTAGQRELQVHHVALRETGGSGAGTAAISTALLVPVVHRRRDTYLCVLLSLRLFHPDAVRFGELLAMDARQSLAPPGPADGSRASYEELVPPEAQGEDLELPIHLEGCLWSVARLVAAAAGAGAAAPADLPRAILEHVRSGVPGRRVVLALVDVERFGVPAGVLSAAAGPDGEPVWRPPVVWPGAGRPADPAETMVREVAVDELPAWLLREFVEPTAGPARCLVAELPPAAGRAILAAGPWRAAEPIAVDERLLVETAAVLLAHRLRAAERERGLEDQVRRLGQALQVERTAAGRAADRPEPVAGSPAMAAALERGRALEALGRPYVVSGPPGAGRRTVARWLAAIGPRRDAPVVDVGCRFHDEAWRRERLFGGAGPGAPGGAPGAIDAAAGGTLLLADVDEAPRPVQAMLLEALRRPRGPGAAPAPLVVATAGGEPELLAQEGRLHPDLAALFGARVVRVPPLAERSEDVVPLAARLAEAAAAELGRAAPRLSPRAIDRLQARPWPGNVRELAAVMAGAVALAADGLVDAEHLSPAEGRPAAGPEGAPPAIDLSVPFAELKRQWIDHFERGYVAAALRRCDGNLSAAARLARMDKKNFHAKASRHGLAGVVPRRGGALKTRSSRHRMPRPPGGSAEGGDG